MRLQRGKAEQAQEAISRNIGAGISTAPHILVSPNDLCHITLSFSHTLYATYTLYNIISYISPPFDTYQINHRIHEKLPDCHD